MRKNKDAEYLEIIQAEFARTGVIPSYRDLAGLLGFAGSPAVVRLVKRLVDSGHLNKAGNRLAPGLRFLDVSSADEGKGASAELVADGSACNVSLDFLALSDPTQKLLLRVTNDALRAEGVHRHDFVLVDRTQSGMHGHLTVMNVSGGYLIKVAGDSASVAQAVAGTLDDNPDFPHHTSGRVVAVLRVLR